MTTRRNRTDRLAEAFNQFESWINPPTARPRRKWRRPQLEPFEKRRLLTITVDTLVDEADGSIVDGDISLRDAIELVPAGETIDFSVIGTITLTMGELLIDDDLTINGPGADMLTIDASGNDPTPAMDNGDGSRVLNIDDSNFDNEIDVAISGLTLTGGDTSGSGGAVFNRENLNITSSTISGNSASFKDGGIANFRYGILTVTNSTLSDNSAAYGGGKGPT